MRLHHVIVVFATALAFAGSASAQQTPRGRCTGLLCDVYYGTRPANAPDRPSLPCNDFVCRAFGHGGDAQPVAVPPQQAAIVEAPMPAKVRKKHKSKVVAKMAPAQPAAATPN